MDVLSDVLKSLRLTEFRPGISERRAPWGTYYPGKTWDVVLYATRGAPCWLTVDSLPESIRIKDNSIAILPHGHAHALRDSLNTDPKPFQHLRPEGYYGLMKYGEGDGPSTFVYLGRFKLDNPTRNPLWAALPPVIHLQLTETPGWIDTLFRWFREELTDQSVGYSSVCSRIGELLIIQSIRLHIDQLEQTAPGLLRALRDPQTLKVLKLMHEQSERQWTLKEIAAEVGVSRSTLAAHFTEVVGESPMSYLRNQRMQKAALLLSQTSLKISHIAESQGYQSEPSFNIAFKKAFGVPPGRFRQHVAGDGRDESAER